MSELAEPQVLSLASEELKTAEPSPDVDDVLLPDLVPLPLASSEQQPTQDEPGATESVIGDDGYDADTDKPDGRWRRAKKGLTPIEAKEVPEKVWGRLGGFGYVADPTKPGLGHRPPPEQQIEQAPRSYLGNRASQVLSHASDVLLQRLRQGRFSGRPVEVQSMYVNGRLLMSENSKAARTKLFEVVSTEAMDTMTTSVREKLTERMNDPEFAKLPSLRHARKLHRALAGKRKWQAAEVSPDALEAQEILTLLNGVHKSGAGGLVTRVSAADAADLINEDAYKGMIIIIDGPQSFHAEQNIMMALKTAGYRAPATLAGVKRPCYGCYLTYKVMNDVFGAQIAYSDDPGFAWSGPIVSLSAFTRGEFGRVPDDDSQASAPSGEEQEALEVVEEFLGTAMKNVSYLSTYVLKKKLGDGSEVTITETTSSYRQASDSEASDDET